MRTWGVMREVNLHVGIMDKVCWFRHPGRAVWLAAPLGQTERIRASGFKLSINGVRIVRVIFSSERNPRVVSNIRAVVVYVSPVIRRRVGVKVDPVIGAETFGSVVRLRKIHTNPNGHVARAST